MINTYRLFFTNYDINVFVNWAQFEEYVYTYWRWLYNI